MLEREGEGDRYGRSDGGFFLWVLSVGSYAGRGFLLGSENAIEYDDD